MKNQLTTAVCTLMLIFTTQLPIMANPFLNNTITADQLNDTAEVSFEVMPKAGTTLISIHYKSRVSGQFVINIWDSEEKVVFTKVVELIKGKSTIDLVDVKLLGSDTYAICLVQNGKTILTSPFIMM